MTSPQSSRIFWFFELLKHSFEKNRENLLGWLLLLTPCRFHQNIKRRWLKWKLRDGHCKIDGMSFCIPMLPFFLNGYADTYLDTVYPYVCKHPLGFLFWEGTYELPPFVEITQKSVVVDIGASLGLFSIPAARIAKYVIAIEPVPSVFDILVLNIKHNNVKNVTPINTGVGNVCGKMRMTIELDNCATTTGNPCRQHDREEKKHKNKQPYLTDEIAVPINRLDDLPEIRSAARIDFIKIDVEGMEQDVIRGAVKTIKKHFPHIVICTDHFPGDAKRLCSLLEDLTTCSPIAYAIRRCGAKLFATPANKQQDKEL